MAIDDAEGPSSPEDDGGDGTETASEGGSKGSDPAVGSSDGSSDDDGSSTTDDDVSTDSASPSTDDSESVSDDDGAYTDEPTEDPVAVGRYSWREFAEEHDHDTVGLVPDREGDDRESAPADYPDWDRVTFDPTDYLETHPEAIEETVTTGAAPAKGLDGYFLDYVDPETTPVRKGDWTWEHFKWAYYYDPDGNRPREDGEIIPFDPTEYLSFDPDRTEDTLSACADRASALADIVDERTVDVNEQLDEDEFFSTTDGRTTIVNRYDLEKAVPLEKKTHFREEQRYWVNKPYAFVIIFHSRKENEKKYYLIEPYRNPIEADLREFLTGKLRTAIKYADEDIDASGDEDDRRAVIERETRKLLHRYDLYRTPPTRSPEEIVSDDEDDTDDEKAAAPVSDDHEPESTGRLGSIRQRLRRLRGDSGDDAGEDDDSNEDVTASDPVEGEDADDRTSTERGDDDRSTDEKPTGDRPTDEKPVQGGRASALKRRLTDGRFGSLAARFGLSDDEAVSEDNSYIEGIRARPEPAVLADDPDSLTAYQIDKLLYFLKRDFIGYERIDGIKHDINVEDISCDGYNSPVFVYHTDYEQIISNVYHGEGELDDFVVKLAQRSGKGISKRRPQVDATLPDGSRAQLTLGREVSDHGTNYTIRQFKDVPFTPVDLINWKTFSQSQMAFLWLCIENHKSLIFAGGTASGKTTSLNAVSLFIPSNTKIVSIEDTREVELPQRNWVASVTRPSFSDDQSGDVDEFDLLEAALRQRPDYIVMGEVRGEEGRTLFQVMSTGHTTYTTFHADSVGEVLKRFTTDPINVSKTMFTALDLVSIQTQTRVQGNKVRRNKELTEVNHYDAENDQINVQRVYQWQAESDQFLKMGNSSTLEEIMFDRGWSRSELETELFKRETILAYLIKNGISEYTKVAATIQAFINDPETILTLIANGQLEASLEDLREMESVHIQVDPEVEALVPRPDPTEESYEHAKTVLDRAEETLLDEYRGRTPEGLEDALETVSRTEPPIEVDAVDADPGGDQTGDELVVDESVSDEDSTADDSTVIDPTDVDTDPTTDEAGDPFDDTDELSEDPFDDASWVAGESSDGIDADGGSVEADSTETDDATESGESDGYPTPDGTQPEAFDDGLFEESGPGEVADSAGDREDGSETATGVDANWENRDGHGEDDYDGSDGTDHVGGGEIDRTGSEDDHDSDAGAEDDQPNDFDLDEDDEDMWADAREALSDEPIEEPDDRDGDDE